VGRFTKEDLGLKGGCGGLATKSKNQIDRTPGEGHGEKTCSSPSNRKPGGSKNQLPEENRRTGGDWAGGWSTG